MEEFVRVAKTEDISPGEMLATEFDGDAVLIINVSGEFYAISESCTHSYCPLTDGLLEGNVIECRCHGAKFDVYNGEVLSPPADEPLKSYLIRVDGNDIFIASPA